MEVAAVMRATADVVVVLPMIDGQSAIDASAGIALGDLVGIRVRGVARGTTGAVPARPRWQLCSNRMRRWLQKCSRCALRCSRGLHMQ